MNNLAKCPFCGSRILIESNTDFMDNVQGYAHLIVCRDCGTRGPRGKTEAEAIELWNRRDGIV